LRSTILKLEISSETKLYQNRIVKGSKGEHISELGGALLGLPEVVKLNNASAHDLELETQTEKHVDAGLAFRA
jgi:hypothetical protein